MKILKMLNPCIIMITEKRKDNIFHLVKITVICYSLLYIDS